MELVPVRTLPLVRGDFQYPPRIVSQWNGEPYFLRTIRTAPFSILRGSLANGTESGVRMRFFDGDFQYPPRIVSQWNLRAQHPPMLLPLFQYPPRIVSQWNVGAFVGYAYHPEHFQYPPRIVSQWN